VEGRRRSPLIACPVNQIRQTNVQEGEAGGITQQIGATYFPVSAIKEKTQVVNKVRQRLSAWLHESCELVVHHDMFRTANSTTRFPVS
jgi:hypothetical protein